MEINPSQPQSQTKVPPPPTPEVAVRTMQSDIRSISQGEVNPMPEVVSPRMNVAPPEQSFIPDAAGPMLTEEAAAPKKSHKGLWLTVIILVILAFIAVGYFIIYPMMSAPVAEPIVENTQPTPVVEPAPEVVAPSHVSAFSSSVLVVPQVTLRLAATSREAIIQGLTDQGALLTNGLTEVVLVDETGGQPAFPAYLAALLPDFLDGQSAGTYMQDDFTAYIYKDDSGVWPGYIVPLRPEGSATLSQWLANFEKTNLSALFVTDPGTLNAFKDGTVKGIADRYATGSTAGASLSYAATATDLHISTSYEGLKAALGALGY